MTENQNGESTNTEQVYTQSQVDKVLSEFSQRMVIEDNNQAEESANETEIPVGILTELKASSYQQLQGNTKKFIDEQPINTLLVDDSILKQSTKSFYQKSENVK
ncbi:uncharacterized protein BYT42DRAFT_640061 [Radiomyces spectabilis]|uniref:uncharacterized protein n=1 Tax=Radiomyces spectabilis TaxID=64574 RepID=UPI00221EE39E|nr:uncharacterized protein BYT42DRAFT_640061 [Radiomyces spectabilis]KAI8374649.1 hypothetical protein BYT42DRAFT_640061 [Radiomyces spectabilis]